MSRFAAIVRGVDEGLKEYGEGVRRQKAIERDDFRFSQEKLDAEEKQRVRDAQKEYAAEMQSARAMFAQGKLPGQEGNIIEGAQDPASVEATRPTGIAPPGAAAPAPAPQPDAAPREQNIFKSNGEGLYKDQKVANDAHWSRMRDITAKYLERTGQVDKLMDLDEKINKWKSSSYDELRKATAAAIATGDPEALRMASRLADLTGLGFKVDPTSGKFDPKTQSYVGVKTIGLDGNEKVEDLSAARLLAVIGQLSPEKLIEWNVGRQDAEDKKRLDERKTSAEESRARSSAATAADNAKTNATTRAVNDDIRRRTSDRADDESAAKFFGSTFGLKELEVKTKDEVEALMPDQRKAYEQTRLEQTKRRELAGYAQNIYTLNERKVAAPVIAQAIPALQRRIAEGRGADGIDPASGLPFVNINGKKILLPKD
jgi:hypothetical protein